MTVFNRVIILLLLAGMCTSCTTLSVMTYNIRYDNPNDGINSWEKANRKEKVAQMIKKYNPDILAVQEALHPQVEYLRQALNYAVVGVGRDDGKTKGEYAAIFYNDKKFKKIDEGHFWLSQTPERPSLGWDATCCNRIATWVHLTRNGKHFYVFNTHLDHEGKMAQRQSATLILGKIQEIAQGTPVVLMGDFNIPPAHPAIQEIKNKLTDGYSVFKNKKNLPSGTFNAFKTEEPLKGKIDYIFITQPEIEFSSYTIDTAKIKGLYPSDHLPIYAELKLHSTHK